MLIAEQKRKENIAEYILYIWQLEDIIRGYNFDMKKIEEFIIKPSNQPMHTSNQIREWYTNMIEAMHAEGIAKQGHLLYIKSIIQDLSSLNISLLQDPSFAEYKKKFDNAVPAIHDILLKSNGTIKNEIDACFNALYGFLILRLQKKEIGKDTLDAVKKITEFINALTSIYHKQDIEQE